MAKALVTSHARREALREALAAQRAEDAALKRALGGWMETLGRPLTHAIRYTLNVELPRDVAWIESCRDTQGEALLDTLRHRLHEMTAEDWRALREGKPHVQRLLARWRVFNPTPRPAPPDRLTDATASQLMAAFCRDRAHAHHQRVLPPL